MIVSNCYSNNAIEINAYSKSNPRIFRVSLRNRSSSAPRDRVNWRKVSHFLHKRISSSGIPSSKRATLVCGRRCVIVPHSSRPFTRPVAERISRTNVISVEISKGLSSPRHPFHHPVESVRLT